VVSCHSAIQCVVQRRCHSGHSFPFTHCIIPDSAHASQSSCSPLQPLKPCSWTCAAGPRQSVQYSWSYDTRGVARRRLWIAPGALAFIHYGRFVRWPWRVLLSAALAMLFCLVSHVRIIGLMSLRKKSVLLILTCLHVRINFRRAGDERMGILATLCYAMPPMSTCLRYPSYSNIQCTSSAPSHVQMLHRLRSPEASDQFHQCRAASNRSRSMCPTYPALWAGAHLQVPSTRLHRG
jgi:hypothetical protein